LYWEFESFLSAISSALDILARICGTAYQTETPVSFTKLCGKKLDHGPAPIMARAKSIWVDRLKDYRDCFIHYTPVDTILLLCCHQYSNGWQVYAKLPVNPNVRDIEGFRYKRGADVLRYSISVYRHFVALDKAIAQFLRKAYLNHQYPQRINNLFFVGKRTRK
ncbi:MAG: hypothetical protein MUO27_11455, partial [Sedimentisphaerales bacterium]|nr:hypothetical protein [Sedimentisphaerales bacterium]